MTPSTVPAIPPVTPRRSPAPGLLAFIAVAVAVAAWIGLVPVSQPRPANAGGVPVPIQATEWTQLANNAELGALVGIEGRSLATEARSLAAQLQQVQTALNSYEIQRRNVKVLPEQVFRQALDPVLELQRIARSAGSVAHSGRELDRFLRSDLIRDPHFDRRGLDLADAAGNYDAWTERWGAALATGLRQSGLTMSDVESEAQLLDAVQSRMGSEEGQLQVLQGANLVASSMARQMLDLRRIAATQAETTTVAWGRVLSEIDREEVDRRIEDREIEETLDSLEAQRGQGRTLNEIFGLDR